MYCVYNLDPIQGQGQGHGAFELLTTSEAVHAGGDDRSPLPGLSGLQARCPSCSPTNSVKALKATSAFGLGRRR